MLPVLLLGTALLWGAADRICRRGNEAETDDSQHDTSSTDERVPDYSYGSDPRPSERQTTIPEYCD